MLADTTTFFLVFATVFLAIGAYMWKLDRDAKRLEFRLAVLEQQKADDATAKNHDQ